VQQPQDALTPSMPLSAIAAVHPDAVLSISEIAQRVVALCSRNGTLPSEPLLVADCRLVTVVISAHVQLSLRFN
jgi:hypothetical protein